MQKVRVIDQHRAPEEADHQARPAADQEADQRQHDGGHELEAVQPEQLGIAGEILDLDEVGRVVPARRRSSRHGCRRSRGGAANAIVLGVGMQVVMAVLRGPPQHALLRASIWAQHREHELEDAAGRKGAVREIAMIAGADGEDAQPVEPDAERDRRPGDAGPDRRDAGEMHQHEGDRRRIHDVVVSIVVHVRETLVGLGVGHGRSLARSGGEA